MSHYTIAILDGHPGAAFVTRRGLEWGLGAQARTLLASSPAAAWELCSNGDVDMLIADPTDYGEAGWTLVRLLHASCPQMQIVVLSADCTPPVRRRVQELGLVCLPKTHEMSEICEAVREVLGFKPPGAPAQQELMLTSIPPLAL